MPAKTGLISTSGAAGSILRTWPARGCPVAAFPVHGCQVTPGASTWGAFNSITGQGRPAALELEVGGWRLEVGSWRNWPGQFQIEVGASDSATSVILVLVSRPASWAWARE
ncbi:MAG: hypothetical protein D9V47_08075 [Clostridia bacterium]|nr:MAG: hypothetical protein D9V47_08075 [Clostridia bacterium]